MPPAILIEIRELNVFTGFKKKKKKKLLEFIRLESQ